MGSSSSKEEYNSSGNKKGNYKLDSKVEIVAKEFLNINYNKNDKKETKFTPKQNNIIEEKNHNNLANQKFLFKGPKNCTLIVHKNDGLNDFILEMNLTKTNKNIFSKQPEFILILDVSGSMSSCVHELVSNIIPRGLNLLNYSDNDTIHLITFESYANSFDKTVGELKSDYSIQGQGGTNMSGVYCHLEKILKKGGENNYRILVLSDGDIGDQDKTVKESERIKQFLKNKNYSISVGSIRYNSGSGQPDTKAISSVLRLNTDTTKTKVLTEVSSSDSSESISQTIYELFKDDYFEADYYIESDKIKFRIDPLDEPKNRVKLNEGNNVIFADKSPIIENVGIYEGNKLKYTKDDFKNGYKIDYQNYNSLLGAKIDMTVRKVRINKTLGSKEALEENKKMINYFENFEKNLEGNKNKEAIIATELKRTNELDITKYDNNELAQFIGVGRNVTPIDDFLNKFLKIDKREEKNVNDFVNNVLQDEGRIDLALEKWFYS